MNPRSPLPSQVDQTPARRALARAVAVIGVTALAAGIAPGASAAGAQARVASAPAAVAAPFGAGSWYADMPNVAIQPNAYRFTTVGTSPIMSSPNFTSVRLNAVADWSKLSLACYTHGQKAWKGHGGMATNVWYRLTKTRSYVWAGDLRIANSRIEGVPACPVEARMPFPEGEQYFITQLPGGRGTHYDEWNRHAYDLSNAESGGTVVAHTGGTVKQAGWTHRSMGNGIQVLIDYGNNRCAQYAHLGSEKVWVGQRVKRGQAIGTVGGSGYGKLNAWGSHLHFNTVLCSDTVTSKQVTLVREFAGEARLAWFTSLNQV